jgi:hypothetical protein
MTPRCVLERPVPFDAFVARVLERPRQWRGTGGLT